MKKSIHRLINSKVQINYELYSFPFCESIHYIIRNYISFLNHELALEEKLSDAHTQLN